MKAYETPPILRGSVTEQLQLLRSYLYRLSMALTESETQKAQEEAPKEQRLMKAAEDSGKNAAALNSAALKTLILKTADTVEQQISIAKQKAGIHRFETVKLQRFEVVRHE